MPKPPNKIGYLILAHNNCEQVSRMVRILNQGNSRVVLHLDKTVQAQERLDYLENVGKAGDFEEVTPIACTWGEWSLVEATLMGLEHFRHGGDPVSHVILLSSSHFPIRPTRDIERFLAEYSDKDFIETADAKNSIWVKDGPNIERFQYFYPYNHRTHPRRFNLLFYLQDKLKVRRAPPSGLRPHLGSQWWCLRFSTIVKMLDYLNTHPRVTRYFKTTWIPDESFFQTLAANLCQQEDLVHVPFVHYAHSPRGRPYVFHNDHEDYLSGERHHFFARKISGQATTLVNALGNRLLKPEGTSAVVTTPSSLIAENAELDRKVADYHRFVKPGPGHMHDNYRELFLEIKHPVFVLIGKSLTETRVARIGESLKSVPGLHFLGRPFQKDVVQLKGVMKELGLGDKSFDVRDRFTCQLFCEFFTRRPCALAFVVDPDLDFESWVSFSNLQNYFPICLTGGKDLEGPRYLKLSYADHVRYWPWGARAQVMADEEVAPNIRELCTEGELSDMPLSRTYSVNATPQITSKSNEEFRTLGKCFVILSYARSGSYLLVDLLNKIKGVRCHGELFKKARLELDADIQDKLSMSLQQRNQNETEYLSRVLEMSNNKTVGFKLLAAQCGAIESYVVGSRDFQKIILKRNIIDVYISLQRAKTTGIWIDRGFRKTPEDPSFNFVPEIFEQERQWHEDYYRDLESCSIQSPEHFLMLDYEQVVDRTAFSKICPFLDVVQPTSNELVSAMRRQTSEPLAELITNFDEMVTYIQDNHPKLYPFLQSRIEVGSGSTLG